MSPADIHKAWGAALVLVVACAVFLGWRQSERHAGAVAVLTHQTDSSRKAFTIIADSQSKAALQASTEAAKLRVAARLEVKKDSVAKVKDDSVHAEAAAERQRAGQLLADSSATLAGLRAEIGRLVDVGRQDSLANAAERLAATASISALLATVRADSTAIAKGLAAYNSQFQATLVANREVALLKGQQPSFIGRHASVTAGYGCAMKGSTGACGPAVVAGWKILP